MGKIQVKKKEINGDTLTPITIFNRIKGRKKFLLESSKGHGEKGRYSFIGKNPFKEIIGSENQANIYNSYGELTDQFSQNALEIVKKQVSHESLDLPFAFYGGAVGFIGYDIIRQYEDIGERLEDELMMPDVHLMFYQQVIVFDHKEQTVTIIALNLDGKQTDKELDAAVKALEHEIIQQSDQHQVKKINVSFTPSIDQTTFVEMVKTAKEHIVNGDVFQVVLSQRMKASFDADPFEFYRRLRIANPSPYMFFVDFESYIVLGASPESLIKTKGKQVITNPIAGTRPRGKTDVEDEALAKELITDKKERAEHKMLVDLGRNDLGRVCEVGSISIPKYMMIERYQHVMHIVSEVHGELTESYTGIDALIATLPAGTVSGAPKIRAMQIINQLEKQSRGVYAGAVGYLNMNGDIDLALAIRTMIIKEDQAYVQAGAGVVFDSDPDSEYQETLNKAKSLLEVQ